jgi:hypothetical protein
MSSRRPEQLSPAILVLAVAIFLLANNANATGSYLLNEKFNDMTTNAAPTSGWTSTATSGSVQIREYPFAADKSVRIGLVPNSIPFGGER